MANTDRVEMNGDRSSAIPFFLTGLGTGIALTLLLAPLTGAATRNLIARKVKDGEKWIKDKADTAKEYVLTHGAGLRDGVKEVVDVIGRS